jgi:hypothetical protein
LIRLNAEGFIAPRQAVIEIGAQQLANNFLDARDSLVRIGKLFGAPESCPLPASQATRLVHGDLGHLAEEAPAARGFWTWLGFQYAAIDIDGSPDSIPLDLNYDNAPPDAVGKYQLVTNFGTTEHIANQLNAFKVIHELAATGGLMMHHLPMQGMHNHGLVNYNPKFFWMLGRSNGYKIVYMTVLADQAYYPLPQNIVDAALPYDPTIAARQETARAADMAVVVVLQKLFDTPYVAPIDVPTGAQTDDKVLEERYWSVFKPDAFTDLPRPRSVPDR